MARKVNTRVNTGGWRAARGLETAHSQEVVESQLKEPGPLTDGQTMAGDIESRLPPAGFYRDANGDTRWWDGAGWTEHIQAHHATEQARGPWPLGRPLAIFVGVLVLLVAAAGAAYSVTRDGSNEGTPPEISEPQTAASDEEAVDAAFSRFVALAASGRRKQACEMVAPSALEWTQPGESCEDIMLPEVWGQMTLTNLTITGDTALIVTDEYEGAIEMKRVGDEWMLTKIA